MMDGQRAALDSLNKMVGDLTVTGQVWHREVPGVDSDANRLR
ncbi:hypothetical protein [Dickeya oryzae]